jgi:hypothetical protein
MEGVSLSTQRITLVSVLLLATGLVSLSAQQHPQKRNFLLNRDVVTLAKAGFTEQIIIETIRATPNRFDVTAEALAALSAQGMSLRVVEAMLVAKICGTLSGSASSPCDSDTDGSSPAKSGGSVAPGVKK